MAGIRPVPPFYGRRNEAQRNLETSPRLRLNGRLRLLAPTAYGLCPEPPRLGWNTYLQKAGMEGKEREQVRLKAWSFVASALRQAQELGVFCLMLRGPSCRKQGTAEPGKLVVAPPGQFHSVEAHLQAPRLSLTYKGALCLLHWVDVMAGSPSLSLAFSNTTCLISLIGTPEQRPSP